MFEPISEREKLWDDFLIRWPLETLSRMTLEQYSSAGNQDSFTYWMESRTEPLGSIWGGSAFKFGVYSRLNKEEKSDANGKSYTDDYAWYTKYGANARDAFEKVRDIIVAVASAARSGNFQTVKGANLGRAYKWKIAFLYQERSAPKLLPIYSPDQIAAYLGEESGKTMLQLLTSAEGRRGSKNLFTYADEVWKIGKELVDAREAAAQSKATVVVTKGSIVDDASSRVLSEVPLNQILCGPPGTGKTYKTVTAALEILDPEFLEDHEENRTLLKQRFDALMTEGRIGFVTFHQSFSYEDFVEGIRAQAAEGEADLSYSVEPGIFKLLCERAATTQESRMHTGIGAAPRIWKISIDGTGASAKRNWCMEHNEARIGWGFAGDLRTTVLENVPELGPNDRSTLAIFSHEMAEGDIVLCIHSATEVGAVGVVTGEYRYEDQVNPVLGNYKHALPVRWLLRDIQFPIVDLNGQTRFTLKTVYEMTRFTWPELDQALRAAGHSIGAPIEGTDIPQHKPYLLIIDEINRGNISRIFGELITLIEPSKRAGAPEALNIYLPYSKKSFSVPRNLYLVGTMNTADRSLASMDIALRRRFVFRDMPPVPELLSGIEPIEGVAPEALLRAINLRIEALLDRDHCLGHAYFMPLKGDPSLQRLAAIFREQIIPLLQEYFFDDWQRIQWVLNDHRKANKAHRFLVSSAADVSSLFGSEAGVSARPIWSINPEAFGTPESYSGIVEST
jgi:5-methylcytosine-specific restriction protein B